MASDGTLRIKVLGDVADFQGKMKSVEGGLGRLSKYALPALGTAAAAGFALATKGALEAETAQGNYMAATGKSREEAKLFVSSMDSLAGSAGAVGESFEEIAGTGTMVEQQFGTTGEKTRELTSDILDFSKVTKQDAVGAAADLEDTLSSYGKTADDAAGFMDQLTLSHQKFGTDVGPQSLDVLRNMSPALQAVGGDLNDGVGFLNLFETAGLDAGAAAVGLNKSIKELKPGQTIDDLIAQVGSIEDPLERAQKAAEIFGSKAGPKLAQAIKPGMTSLDDFKVSAQDAAGATEKASEDMLTFSDRIQGWAQKGLAGLREVGQQFGPVVTALGSMGSLFGPAIASSLGKGWELAMGNPALKGAVTAAGGVMGGWLALGIVTLGGVAIGAAIWQSFQDAKNKIETDPQSITHTDLFQARAPMWAIAKTSLAAGMQGLAAHIADERNEFVAAAQTTAASFADGFTSSGSWADAGKDAALSTTQGFYDYWSKQDAFRKAGEEATANLVHGLASGIPDAHDIWKQYVKSMHNALDPAKEEAWLIGKLTSKKLQQGLASENPFVRQAAIDARDALQKQLDDLHELGYEDGKDLGQGLTAGVDSQKPAFTQSTAAYDDSVSRLPWAKWGNNIGTTYAHGITAGINGVNFTGKIDHLLDLVRGFSPPKAGPLKDIGRWGFNVGKAWADGFTSGLRPDLTGVLTPTSFSQFGATSAAAPGGLTINGGIHVTVQGGVTNAETGDAVEHAIENVLGRYFGAARGGSTLRFRTTG